MTSVNESIEADSCPDRPDPMKLCLEHCWHLKPIQISTGNTLFDSIEVVCCFCGCSGIGIPQEIHDPDHGRFNPIKKLSINTYALFDLW